MPTVQIVPGSLVTRAPYAGAPTDLAAAQAPGRALEQVGQQVGNTTSRVLEEFAVRKQNATNAMDLLAGDLAMKKSLADYQDQMAREPDPDKWVPGWDDQLQKTKAAVLENPKLAPVVKEHLTNAFTEFGSVSSSQIKTQANVRDIQQKKAIGMVYANTFWDAGQFEPGEYALDQMREHGLISDVEQAQLLAKGHTQVAQALVNRGINQDPIGTMDKLDEKTKSGDWANFDGLDENQREAFKVEARRATSALRAETINSIGDRRNAGEIIPKDELQSLVDQRKLTAYQMKWVLQEQSRQGFDPLMTKAFADHLTAVDAYDKTSDPTNEKFAELTADRLKFSADLRAEAKSRLDAKLNPTATNIMTKDANHFIDEMTEKGVLGPTTTDKGRPTQVAATYAQNVQLKRELSEWVKANPGKSPVDQVAFIRQRLQGPRDVAATLPLFNALSGRAQPTAGLPTVTTPDAYAKLQPGARYIDATGKPATKGK